MRSIILFCIGFALGILAFMFAMYCILFLYRCSLGAGIASGVFALICGGLSYACFAKM